MGRRSRSGFIGVSWSSGAARWEAYLYEPETPGRHRRIARFDRALDAAIAYDRVVLHQRGPDAPRNFPRRALEPASIAEIRAEVRRARKVRATSRYVGVALERERDERPWRPYIKLDGKLLDLGAWRTQKLAALARDRAILFYGLALPLAFPGGARRLGGASAEALRRACERERKRSKSSKYTGVSRLKGTDRYRATFVYRCVREHLGVFDDEVKAAQAFDQRARAAGVARYRLNFPE
jgi:hypothetical protein